jgi:hypothetical protein
MTAAHRTVAGVPGLLFLLIAAAVIGMQLRGRMRARAHLDRWAAQHGLRVRSATLRLNPFGPFFLHSNAQRVWNVTFQDDRGHTRQAIVKIGGWFVGSFSDQVEVVWRS